MDYIQSTTRLNNGVKMPWLGFGLYKVEKGQEVENAVREALDAGYRSIDTASYYGNEGGVGRVIAESGIPREELFITTKVWNDEQGYEKTLAAFEKSREKLGIEVIDLYLIHWPVPATFQETWKALEKLYSDGKVRAIGVSNFLIPHLEELLKGAKVVPAVNQVEYHPWLSQQELHDFCKSKGIQLVAWSPLARARKLDDPVIQRIAEKHGKTPAQVILRWDIQMGIVTIPKSVTPERIRENKNIFDFSLTEDDMKQLLACNEEKRFGSDPHKFL